MKKAQKDKQRSIKKIYAETKKSQKRDRQYKRKGINNDG